MPKYSCYGLIIDSELPLPETLPSDAAVSDLVIRFGQVQTREPEIPSVVYRTVSPEQVYVLYRGVGAALVSNGHSITIRAETGVDPLVFRLFILQQVIGVALLQRGLFVLHASAAVVNGRAVAFAGLSGQGKSTLSAALHGLGGQILSDDVLAIDLTNPERPIALPGLAQLKLTEQTRGQVAPQIAGEQAIGGKRGKVLCAIHGEMAREGVPLDSIYILGSGSEICFEAIPPARAAILLVANTYGSKLLSYIARAESHFQQCAELARRIPVVFLARPRDLRRLGEAARMVIDRVKPAAL